MSSSFAYRHSPIWAQELLISAKSSLRSTMREGRAFGAMAAEIHKSEWWSERRLRAFQSEKLQMIAQSAVSNVPYYRNKYRPLDLDFERLEFPEALAKLPLIDKADVRAAGKSLISERKQDVQKLHDDWTGDIRDMIVPATQEKPPYWRVNRAENMLMLSSYHLSESAAPSYLDSLARFDPVVIQAYPSSIGFLATWMLSTGSRYRGISLRGIVTSSETLSEVRRREIESAFGCRVFDWYGQFERVAAIGTCEQGRHHLLSDYSFVEMLPAEDGLFELVGTGFNNLSMPLIRYRCGDLVRPAPANERCSCGRSFPLIERIIGRVDDSIKLSDGRSVGRLDHLFKGVEGIIEAQIRQDRLDTIVMLVVPSPTFNERTRETLQSNARYRLGDGIALEIQLVDSIPRTRNGKFKGVVCNV